MSTLLLDPKLINYLLTALYAAKRGTLGRPWKLARRGLLVGGVDHHLGPDLRICAAMTAIAHALADRGNDVYETPEVAVEALLKAESLPAAVWEPACGPGAIVRVLRRHGHVVYATDLVDYNSPDQDASGWIFFSSVNCPLALRRS